MKDLKQLENELKTKSELKMKLEQELTNIRNEIEVTSVEGALSGKGMNAKWYKTKKDEFNEVKRNIENLSYECGSLRRIIINTKRSAYKEKIEISNKNFVIAAKQILDKETYSKILEKAESLEIEKKEGIENEG
ncbi:hypothetical protein QJR26_06980 [Clostridium baratii]